MALPYIEVCMERVLKRTVITGQFVSKAGITDRFNQSVKDINELLDKRNNLSYKYKIKNVNVLFFENDTHIHEFIWIKNGAVEYLNTKQLEEFNLVLPSLKQYYSE